MNPNNTLADQVGSPAFFLGESAQGQFLFGNGTPIASHIFSDLKEGAERFGHRLDTKDREYIHSGPYANGRTDASAAKPYNPVRSYGRQAVLEYGHGYLRGLLDKMPKKPTETVLTAEEHARMMNKAGARK